MGVAGLPPRAAPHACCAVVSRLGTGRASVLLEFGAYVGIDSEQSWWGCCPIGSVS